MKTQLTALIITGIVLLQNHAVAGLPACISKHYPGKTITTEAILLDTPDIAENGAVVSIAVKGIRKVDTDRFVRQISFYNEFRDEPVARFILGKNTHVDGLKTRFRLRESSNIFAVAELDNGQLISGSSFIKVTIEGCGGGGLPTSSGKAKRVCEKSR
jgi:predicted secreted protein